MDAEMYVTILRRTLLPFLREVYPDGHRFMQDNDPKHTSRRAADFFEEEGVNWWRTPPESPDMNPIENLWHELKEFIRREVKPHTKEELIRGINLFWGTVNVEKCTRYIHHLRKVFPRVINDWLLSSSFDPPLSLSVLLGCQYWFFSEPLFSSFNRFFSEPPHLHLVHLLCYHANSLPFCECIQYSNTVGYYYYSGTTLIWIPLGQKKMS